MTTFEPPDLPYSLPDNITENEEDVPIIGKPLTAVGAMAVPEIIFGGGTLSKAYNSNEFLQSEMPFRTLRLAMRYGIRFIDTSPFYGNSEIILGQILNRLASEFPRSSYRLMTKCGRYGNTASDFDYSPQTIRQSVMRSMQRLGTTYLDVVLLHDVEFVASPVWPIPYCGDFGHVLNDATSRVDWGIALEKAPKAWGRGDDAVLGAIQELQKMKQEGFIKAVGISGYPLPTLLRLARLISTTLRPLDCLLSYSHTSLQNSRLEQFLPSILKQGRVTQVFTASPLSMGLLGPKPPKWHPAPEDMFQAARVAATAVSDWPGGLPNLATGFAFRRPKSHAEMSPYNDVPTVAGFSNVQEVHEAMAVWREISIPGTNSVRKSKEDIVKGVFAASGWLNWSWSSPFNSDFEVNAVDNLGRRVRSRQKEST